MIKLFLRDLFALISPFKFFKLWVIFTDDNEISKTILLVIMLKTLCLDYTIREKRYIYLKSLEGKDFFKLLLMFSLPNTLFSIVSILAFSSTGLLILAAPWWNNLKDSFSRFDRTLSRVMRMGSGNNTVCIVCYKLIICKNFIFLKVDQRPLGIFSFRLPKLVLRVCTLTHRLSCIWLKSNLSTSCGILISERSASFLEKTDTMRVYTHLMDDDVCVSSSHKFFRKLGIALEIHVSSLTALAFKI